MGEDFEAARHGVAPAGVDGHHHALAAELGGQLPDHARTLDGCRVHGDLVGAGTEDPAGIVDRPDATTHGEWDEHLLGGPPHDVDDRVPCVGGGRDVEEHQFVGSLPVVAGRQLDRIAGVPESDEVDPLDDTAIVYVEARDDSHGPHGVPRGPVSRRTASATSTVPS